MMGFLELLFGSGYSLSTVLLIVIAGIIVSIKFISWIKGVWEKRTAFQQNAVREGERLQHERDVAAEEETCRKAEIKALQENVDKLTLLVENQQKQIDLLTRSDELTIKAWIKEQHDKWTALGCIDSQSLELICQRFDIYKEEGGNSWAEVMVNEIKELPTITVIPVAPQN